MGLYNHQKIKERTEEKLQKEMSEYYDDINEYDFYFTDKEFERYYLLTQILSPSTLKKWHFYSHDMLWDIIEETDIYKMDTQRVYDLEMYLEHLLREGKIEGFLEIGSDIWIANLGSD